MLLLALQALGQPGAKALSCTAGEAVQTGAYVLPSLFKVAGELTAIAAQALAQVGLKGGDSASGQRNGNHYLHQKSDTKGNKHRPQEAAS
ncbi:hypothetical protein D3C73_1318860 [compost metagenome]